MWMANTLSAVWQTMVVTPLPYILGFTGFAAGVAGISILGYGLYKSYSFLSNKLAPSIDSIRATVEETVSTVVRDHQQEVIIKVDESLETAKKAKEGSERVQAAMQLELKDALRDQKEVMDDLKENVALSLEEGVVREDKLRQTLEEQKEVIASLRQDIDRAIKDGADREDKLRGAVLEARDAAKSSEKEALRLRADIKQYTTIVTTRFESMAESLTLQSELLKRGMDTSENLVDRVLADIIPRIEKLTGKLEEAAPRKEPESRISKRQADLAESRRKIELIEARQQGSRSNGPDVVSPKSKTQNRDRKQTSFSVEQGSRSREVTDPRNALSTILKNGARAPKNGDGKWVSELDLDTEQLDLLC